MKKRKSFVLSLRKLYTAIEGFLRSIFSDNLTLYAAQASFFTMISSIPFLMILITLVRMIFPDAIDYLFGKVNSIIPEGFSALFNTVYLEISQKNAFPVLSISAVTMLWSSSRGVASVTRGIAQIYGTRDKSNFISEILRSFFHTLTFIAMIIGALTVLVFGATIRELAASRFSAALRIFDLIIRLRSFIFIAILTLFFAAVYFAVSRNGIKNTSPADEVPSGWRAQFPGAFLASLGWMLFSYFYSLYIIYFPNASYVYGSLAAVVLFMLWVYFCMEIFLVGAEFNKLLHLRRKNHKKTKI